jgi:predicted Fe-S protein YdhL (DUF1289 family)
MQEELAKVGMPVSKIFQLAAPKCLGTKIADLLPSTATPNHCINHLVFGKCNATRCPRFHDETFIWTKADETKTGNIFQTVVNAAKQAEPPQKKQRTDFQ